VGSDSAHGAGGTLLPDALRRITACPALQASSGSSSSSSDAYDRALRKSFVISADMAHALHPNYADRHDAALGPMMHKVQHTLPLLL
jgi:aspartyl aminopeptidase